MDHCYIVTLCCVAFALCAPSGVEESESPRASPAALVLPRAGPFVRSDRLPAVPSQVEGSRVHAGNPFRIRTYEKCARKSPRTHTYKIIGLKPSWNHTLTKNPGGTPASCILASAIFLCRILAATRSMQCADAALPPPYQATEGRRVRLQSRHAQGKLKL